MATTVEVNPTSVAIGEVTVISVKEAPVSGGRPPHPTNDLCTLSIEGRGNGVGISFTVTKPDRDYRLDTAMLDAGAEGEYDVKLFRWDDYFKPNRDELTLASAILNLEPAAE